VTKLLGSGRECVEMGDKDVNSILLSSSLLDIPWVGGWRREVINLITVL